MDPKFATARNPLGKTPGEIMADRRKVAVEEQRNATPPVVPLANPPTTMAEVPPGIAPIRAVPARKPGDHPAKINEVPKDTVGETTAEVPRDREGAVAEKIATGE